MRFMQIHHHDIVHHVIGQHCNLMYSNTVCSGASLIEGSVVTVITYIPGQIIHFSETETI